MSLSHLTLRKLFAEFWKSKDHKEVPPISLVPKEDPTTLFTGSGMQPLVPYLLGEPHPLGEKLYNIQPCFRAQDIEEIGDNRHTTFFEMMGNWSLGTYFKEEQIPWIWDFYTKKLNIPEERLFVTVFAGNDLIPEDVESYKIWKKLGVSSKRIFKYGADKNWWSRSGEPKNMPPGEPGGPDTEIFYDFGEDLHFHQKSVYKDQDCHPNCDCGRYVEIGNSVFMQYQKQSDGTFKELPKKNVDFGGGLERILMANQNRPNVFEIDIFKNLYENIQTQVKGPLTNTRLRRIGIFLDHSRATIFVISSGVFPGKNDREYVLRRLIRRADDNLNILFQGDRVTCESIWENVFIHFQSVYKSIYSFDSSTLEIIKEELGKYQNVSKHIETEKNKFLNLINEQNNISTASGIAGPIAFEYQASKGIPFETSKLLAEDVGMDLEIFEKEYLEKLHEHKKISKAGASKKFKGGLADHSQQTIKYHTATHLIHQALFDVLGNEIRQDGSNITVERLRFDFYSPNKPTSEDIKQVEKIVNEKVREGLLVRFKMVPKEEAVRIGARAFFKEKYSDTVKVYFIGDYSKEFCGGPHVKNTKEVGKIEIYKFERIGSNLYRIYAK